MSEHSNPNEFVELRLTRAQFEFLTEAVNLIGDSIGYPQANELLENFVKANRLQATFVDIRFIPTVVTLARKAVNHG